MSDKLTAERLRALDEADTCPVKVGDRVQRAEPRSYLFPGVVIAVGMKLDGKTWHAEVETIAPGNEGMTHVFPAHRLEPLAPGWLARSLECETSPAILAMAEERDRMRDALKRIAIQAGELAADRYTPNSGLWSGCEQDARSALGKDRAS